MSTRRQSQPSNPANPTMRTQEALVRALEAEVARHGSDDRRARLLREQLAEELRRLTRTKRGGDAAP